MAAWLRQLGPLTIFVFMLLKMAHYGLSGVTATTGHLKCHAVFRCKRKSFFLFKTFSIWRMYRSKKLSHFLFWDWNWTCSAVDIVSEQTKQKSLVYRKLNSTDRYHPPIQKKKTYSLARKFDLLGSRAGAHSAKMQSTSDCTYSITKESLYRTSVQGQGDGHGHYRVCDISPYNNSKNKSDMKTSAKFSDNYLSL